MPLTYEDLEALERQLTSDEVVRAVAIVRENGWTLGNPPPPWVWQQVYVDLLTKRAADG